MMAIISTLGGWLGLAKWAGILILAGTLAWVVDDYYYLKGERDRLQAELHEAVVANQSLQDAMRRQEEHHKRETAALTELAAAERERQQALTELAQRLAKIAADQDCTPGPELQDLIDSLR